MSQIHPEHSPCTSAENGSSANLITINLGGTTLVVVAVLVTIIGACGVVMGVDIAERSAMEREFQKLTDSYKELKTQNWLLERRLMDREALDIIHGDKLPSDDSFGATGNLQRMKPKGK
jgi:hypothetical protein